jgi:hypothetical protein
MIKSNLISSRIYILICTANHRNDWNFEDEIEICRSHILIGVDKCLETQLNRSFVFLEEIHLEIGFIHRLSSSVNICEGDLHFILLNQIFVTLK